MVIKLKDLEQGTPFLVLYSRERKARKNADHAEVYMNYYNKFFNGEFSVCCLLDTYVYCSNCYIFQHITLHVLPLANVILALTVYINHCVMFHPQ